MKDIKLSEYQENIINFAKNDYRNCLINAYAGTGKSFTLIKIMENLSEEKTKLYCAFNKSITLDIKDKTKHIKNLTIKTIHSVGLSIIRNNNEFNVDVDKYKYVNFINDCASEISSVYNDLSYNKKMQFRSTVNKLITLCQQNLCDGKICCENISKKFGLVIIGDEIKCCIEALKWGKENVHTVTEGDMVWLPNVLPYRFPKYDYVIVDECQDLSIAQQEIVKKCRGINTRFFYAGDKNQCIYSFSGSDSESFDKIAKLPNLVTFILPLCYRCDTSIVRHASQIVNDIKEDSEKDNGTIIFSSTIKDIKDGDTVLCRTNAPLMKLFFEYLENGVKCYFNGKDLGDNLLSFISEFNTENLNDLFSSMYEKLIELKETIKKYENCDDDTAISSLAFRNYLDKIETLKVISKGCNKTIELTEKIKNIFANDEKNGIILSSVHKAKGLEWDNVHILCPSLFNNNIKRATETWETEQEVHLKYVAITRAKHNLYYIEDSNYAKTVTSKDIDSLKLNLTEKEDPKEKAKEITKQFKEIKIVPKTNTITLNSKKETINNFKINLKNKLKRI